MSSPDREMFDVEFEFGEKNFFCEFMAAMSSLSLRFWVGRSLDAV